MVVTNADGRVLFCSPARPGSCADIAHARQLGLVQLLADGPAVEVLADAGYQGLGAQTGGRVVTPPPREFKKNAPDWYEEMHERQRKAHSSRRVRVEHGIAHLKNWRAPTRLLGHREHMSDTVQAVAALLSHQQTADLASVRKSANGRSALRAWVRVTGPPGSSSPYARPKTMMLASRTCDAATNTPVSLSPSASARLSNSSVNRDSTACADAAATARSLRARSRTYWSSMHLP